MLRLLCYIGIHNWILKKEKHKVINHEYGRECIRVVVKECSICGMRKRRVTNSWKNCNFDKDSIINLKDSK